jgi:hypothetical protein
MTKGQVCPNVPPIEINVLGRGEGGFIGIARAEALASISASTSTSMEKHRADA